jgi:hypothetical protein
LKWLLGAAGAAVIAVPITAWLSGGTIPHKGLFRFLRSDVSLSVVLILVLAFTVLLVLALLPSCHARATLAVDLDGLRGQHAEARQVIRSLDTERGQLAIRVRRDAIYARALVDVFAHLDVLLAAGPTDAARAVEKTVLEPMCGVFSQQQRATVRMAVLEVAADAPFEYMMSAHVNWGTEAENFRWSTAEPLDNLGFETQETVVAYPILRGGTTDALLVSMAPEPFAPEDREYIALIATAVGLTRAAARREA